MDGIIKKQNNMEKIESVVFDVNSKRRSFLKYLFFGSGFFLAGKILGPSINLFSGDTDFGKITDFKNFRVVETGKELTFFDRMGNEILSLDKIL